MSTLQPLNVNKFLERLRERAEERGYEIDGGWCSGCDARLTETDLDLGQCSQCSEPLSKLDQIGDEFPDEDLYE